MAEDQYQDPPVDEFGIPIKKKGSKQPTVDEFGIPIKKKVSIADVGMAARGGGEVGVSKAPSGESTPIVSKPGVNVEAYNTGMRQKLGVPKVNLGSDLPQIKKAREEKEYLKLRDIEENDIIPFETAVFTGTVQPTQIKELANKPYGKKVINDVLRDHAPEAGGLSFDDDVFRNEQNAEQVAQVLQQKFRQQGLEIQNQNLFNLDKEVSENLNGLKRIDIAVSAGTGGGAANVSEYNLPQLNTSSPSDLGEALDFLSKSEGSSFEVNGRKLSQKEITDLSDKINEKLYYIKAGEPIHPEILSEEVSTKLANAVSKVDAEWKGDINYSPNQKQELVQKDIQYAEEGLNFLKDANKVAYNNIMNGILKKEKIADVDYEQLIGIGKRLENEKKFRGGEFVKDDDRDFRTYQTLKADEAKVLSEKIKEMGFKNKAKIADKVIVKAALESGIDPNSKRVLDIRRDEALGGYGIVKGGGLTALARGISQPFKSIQTTLNSIFDDPTTTYLNSRRYDYGDQIVPNAAGNYSDVLPSERGYKNVGNVFNKILEGVGQFATQVFTSRLGGQILSAPYRAAALSVPRAALTTTQATNIAAYGGGFLSTALQTYGQSYVDFLNKTGNPNKAAFMAIVDALGQSALEVGILPDVKLAESMKDALGSAKRNLATDIMKVVEKGAGKEAAKTFIKKFVQEAGKVYGKEILGEEVSQNMFNYLVESIFSPETAEKRNLTDETKEVIKEASLSMVVPIVLGGLGGAKRNRKLTQDALHISAQNFETFTEAIENGRVKGIINPQDADAALNIIKIHQQSIENAPKEDSNGGLINAARQLEYAYQNTVEQVAKEKLSKITDEVQAEPVKKQIKEAQEVKRKIFNGAEMSGIPKEEKEEQPTIDQDRVLGDEDVELTPEQKIIQQAIDNNEVDGMFLDMAKAAVADPQQAKQLLDEAKSQATGQVAGELGSARSGVEKAWGKTIADFVAPQGEAAGVSGSALKDVGEILRGDGFVESKNGGLEKNGVRIVISKDAALGVDKSGNVFNADSSSDNIVLKEINVVDESARGKGNATEVLRDFLKATDEMGKTVFIEPTTIKKYQNVRNLNEQQLINWYERHGFKKINDQVWKREPNAKIKETDENADAENRLTYEEADRYRQAIAKGEMTSLEAKKAIEDMGFIVPKDIAAPTQYTEAAGGSALKDVEETAKKIVGESAFEKLKKEGYTIEKGKFDSDAYASFFGLHTGVQADEFANAGLRLVKPSEKIKVYRGKGKNVSEGENEGVTWVAEDKKVAENYSNDGNVEEIEVTKPKNPFPNPTDTIHVKGSDVGNKLKGILNRLFREGKVTKEQAIEASKAIDEFVLAAGEESELYSTKTNKKGVSSKYVKALQALGFDGIVQKESYNSGSPFTATKTGNETNTYGIFKAPTQYTEAATPAKKESEGVSGSALKDVDLVKDNGKKIISKALGENENDASDFKNTKVVDDNGKPKQVFHGTWADAPFEDFKEGDTYFTDNYDTAKMFGSNREGGVDTENMDMQGKPFVMEVTDTKGKKHKMVIANTDMASIFSDLQYDVSPVGEWGKEDLNAFDASSIEHHFGIPENKIKSFKIEERQVGKNVDDFGVSRHYINLENPLIIDAKGDIWNGSKGGDIQGKINEARESGKHDGVIVKNIVEGGLGNPDTKPTTTYVVFNKNPQSPPQYTEAATPNQETKPVSTSGIKKSNRGVVKKARGIEDLTEPRDIVMQYFAGGNKINQSAIKELFGGKDERLHFGKGTGGEQKSKISLLKGDAPSIKELAHKLWESSGGLKDDYRYTDRDFRDAIESVLQDHNSPTSMSIELVDKYINKAVKQELTDQEAKDISDGLISDITKYVEELPENQQSELVKLLSKYQDKFGFIDWDAVEKDSNGFDPDILSLTIETQEALDGIIQKNLKSGQGELSDASRQGSRQEKGEEKVIPQKKPEEPITPPTTQAKELADKVRKLKIDLSKLSGGGLQSNPLGLPVAVWNGAMEIVAKTIEAGGTVSDAIKRGLNYIQKNHRGQWNKKQFNDEVMKELGVRGITVNGEDLVVKDVDKEFAETINGFYSDLEQTILEVSPIDKGTPQAWLKKIGTGDEAKWTGVTDWLNSLPKDQKVTRKEILDWLKENRIQVVEVVKGEDMPNYKLEIEPPIELGANRMDLLGDLGHAGNLDNPIFRDYLNKKYGKNGNKIYDWLVENATVEGTYSKDTKFSQYQLEGEKENYKEVLVTLPSRVRFADKWAFYKSKGYSKEAFDVLDDAKKQDLFIEFKAEDKRQRESSVADFKSSHFDEPNILVHLRMNTRVDAEGNKVLFLEEVQSDWGQKGKKEGFKEDVKEGELPSYAKIEKVKVGDTDLWKVYDKSGHNIVSSLTKEDAIKRANTIFKNATDLNTPSAPFVTDTNSWAKLGLKVALKEAVKQGADKIAWTTGEQQNDRYDLSKSVDGLEYQPQRDGKYDVFAHKGDNNIFYEKGIDLKRIEDVFGKDIADKISKNEGTKATYDPNKFYKRLEGDGLKVGGKGMKGFYGSPTEGKLGIVGEVAKSLFKQEPKTISIESTNKTIKDYELDGVGDGFRMYEKVDSGSLKEIGVFKTREDAQKWINKNNTSTQHSIDITPELIQEVEGGLPLFRDIKGRGKEIADLLRKGKIKMGGLQSNIAGIPIAIYNAAIETIALALEGGTTLAQAIQKAINKHKLNQQKDFNQKEFISKLEDATGERFTDDQQEPPKPPKEEPSPLEGDEGSRKKAVLNRLYNAKNTPEEAKKAFEREKLDYKPSSQKAAADLAKSIVDEFGVDEAVRLADSSSMFEGDVRTLIFAEVLNRLQGESNAKKWAEVAITMDKFERSAGRATAAVNYFYKNNPYGVVLKEQADRKEAFDKWATPKKEQEWKEYFELIKKEPEFEKLFQERVSEELKKERAESRKNRIVKVRGIFKKAKDSLKSNNTYATIIPPHILETVLETMELAYEGGEAVATLIQDAIDTISKKLGHSNWDSDKFRKEWEEKLKEPSNKPLTEEEQKKKVLDKFRNKLKGLTDKQKDEVVRRMFEKVVNAGALEYDDLRDIIADTLGYGELTKDESKRLQELVQKRNATDEAALKAREAGENLRAVKNLPETDFVNKKEEVKKKEKEAEQALENYYKTEIEAGKAARELQELLWNKPDVVKRITSIMQLSTLGIPALINNPIYNFFNQIGVRFPVGLVNSTIDKTASLVAKAMGKPYQREYNIFETQGEFWSKLMLGTKESAQQLFTGLNRQDYIQKEYYGQQIRPMRALKDLINYKQGKKKLTQKQIWDKALQASVGVPAEVVARVLNLGDKPMRFSAEGSQAAAFAKTLGLKGIDYKLFIEFPREEAYRAYKQKGLTEEEASTKADYVKEAIIQEGKRATFQQDNLLNDAITLAASTLGGKDSGVANLTKALVISPYIKIPTNAFWSYYNLINPEVSILQSLNHARKAKLFKNDGKELQAKLQMREARYWMAHAITGMATRAVVIMLVQSGVYVSGSGDDESKKERDAKSFFEQPGSINISKLKALINGEDPSKVKGGLLISNRWIGQFGTVGNAIVSKYEDATPEQREAQDDFWRIVLGGMELDALKEMENGIFANSSSLLQSISNMDFSRYGTNTLNMFANILQPATFAQMNRAALDEVPQAKGDTFLQKLNQNFAQRSTIYRNMFNVRLQYKRNMWGETMPKGGNLLSRMFGISKIDDKKDGRPMYDDYMRTMDTGFIPPAVLNILNNEKLTTAQHDRLDMYIGNERKDIALPYINDKLKVPILGLKYSELPDDETKKAVLKYLYQVGRENGLELFYKDFPELEPKDKSIEEQVKDQLLQEALELIKINNSGK